MLSTYAFSLPTDANIGASDMNYANIRTPGKASLKTPGRTLQKGRGALQENAGHDATTVKKKVKGGVGHTPFHPAIQARKALQSAHKPTVVVSRPLGDKTPAPNRHQAYHPLQTPAPQTIKMAKLSLLEAAPEELAMPTPGALLRPSSTRKSLRAPRNSGSGQKMLQFKTPATNGRHWDVSDGDIQVNTDEAEAETAEVEVDDYDELEYMPPKVPEQSYEPPFDMPDYKTVGKTLMSLAWTAPVDEMLDIQYDRPIDQDINVDELLSDTGASNWEKPELMTLNDEDPFQYFSPVPASIKSDQPKQPTSSTSAGQRPSRPTTTVAHPIARSATVSTPCVISRVPSTATKPASAPRTTSNTPAPRSTSVSSRNAATTIRRSVTSIGIRAPASKIVPPKTTAAPNAGTSGRTVSNATARTITGSSIPSLTRSRSVAGRPVSTISGASTSNVKGPTRVVPAPVTRPRSATVATSSRTAASSNLLSDKVEAKNILFNVEDTELEDFTFDV